MAARDEVDVCESWEDMDEIGVSVTECTIFVLAKSLIHMCEVTNKYIVAPLQLDQKIKLMSNETEMGPVKTSGLNGCKVTSVIVEERACIGSQCVMPEPAIRILKRPSTLGSGQVGENRARPVKTLQQRQKEYEEARLRILGEARSPEDVIEDKYVLYHIPFLNKPMINDLDINIKLNVM